MNRIARYALALALGLSVGSPAAFADAPQTQTSSAQPTSPPYVPQTPSPYNYNFSPGA